MRNHEVDHLEEPILSNGDERIQFGRFDRYHNFRVRIDTSECPEIERQRLQQPLLHVRSFKRTIRALQLDHSQAAWSCVSWTVGLLLLVVIPVLRLCFVVPDGENPKHKLVFQQLVVLIGFAISSVSFLFLNQAIRRHGFRGVLFLDAAEEEAVEVRKEYHSVIELCWIQLAKLFIPAFVIYFISEVWFFSAIKLVPLPLNVSRRIDLVIIASLTTISWIFRTTTYLYTCVLFSTVCALQELKMKQYRELLGRDLAPETYYSKYVRIVKGLQATSRRFRLFLALSGTITVFGALASMYEVVEAHRSGISMLMAGEIFVLNFVNLTGIGLCLMSASKIAHLHRRIIKAACSMHARGTFVESNAIAHSSTNGRKLELPERIEMFFQNQASWSRRAAFVNFLSQSSAGISVYGFVLDRFFVHTSIGALLTTTWFILGRSLGS